MTSVLSFKNLFESIRQVCMGSPFRDYAVLFEEKTKLNIAYFVLINGLLLTVFIFVDIGASFIVNLVGFLYPSWMTVRSLERQVVHSSDSHGLVSASKSSSSSSLLTRSPCSFWLVYWSVYSALGLFESGKLNVCHVYSCSYSFSHQCHCVNTIF